MGEGSRLTRECPAGFNERRWVQLPPATNLPKTTRRVVFGTQTVILIREPAGNGTESAIDEVMTNGNTSTSQTVVLVQRRLSSSVDHAVVRSVAS